MELSPSTTSGGGSGLGARARPVDGEASATREKTRSIRHELCRVPETTMFLTGSFKSHPRNQIYTRNRVISGVFLCFRSKNGEWSPALPDYCPQFYHSFLWILHLYFEDSLCTLTNLKMSSKSNCMLRALHILARLQLKQMCVLTTTLHQLLV